MDETLRAVAGLLRQSRHPLFITGAGLSADSGLPTYRGVGGLYEGQATEDGLSIEEALSAPVFRRHPALTWKYLWQIGAACRQASFNAGHAVIAAIERAKPDTWVLTQNIDGFHHAAGSRNLIEVHGRGSRLYCLRCGYRTTASELLGNYGAEVPLPPSCPRCGGLVRPEVVLFGEMLPEAAIRQMEALLEHPRDLVFVVGTSGQFPYISAPVMAAARAGVPTVEINPGRTGLSDVVAYRLAGGAAATLQALWRLAGEG